MRLRLFLGACLAKKELKPTVPFVSILTKETDVFGIFGIERERSLVRRNEAKLWWVNRL